MWDYEARLDLFTIARGYSLLNEYWWFKNVGSCQLGI